MARDYQDISVSIARTNKLWCSGCSRKIKKGERVVFFLDVTDGKPSMDMCYCTTCKDGSQALEDWVYLEAEKEAFGIGQQ